MLITLKTYAHSGKDSNREFIEEIEQEKALDLSETFKNKFMYINYEVELVYEFDTVSNTKRLISVDGLEVVNFKSVPMCG